MDMVVLAVCFFVGAVIGGILGYRYRAKQDDAALDLAAIYKNQADVMMARLVELEDALQEDE